MTGKISTQDFTDIYSKASEVFVNSREIRFGQALFNVLFEINSDVANEIRGTKYDPFYRNENIGRFTEYLLGEADEN